MIAQTPRSHSSAPHGKLTTFDVAEIRSSKFNGDLFLYVEGEMPEIGWNVIIAPRIYHDKPEYLEVEILRVQAPANQYGERADIYKLSIPLNDIIGSKGVKVIGLDTSQSLDLE